MTLIKSKQSEDFNEFHTPCRPDWSDSVSADAQLTLAFDAVMPRRRSSPQAKKL
ncbi:hypothetical protein SynBIOSE41_01502 [Synechococcus sp. BIOS-E4-1]|nr:hypothetical protein SynBIOSE41_01502 [Synechococcus sp. BIOS-E4-1]